VTDLLDLVPARMLNEYAYCPRLFFPEWVDSMWASNADVAEGRPAAPACRRRGWGGAAAGGRRGQGGAVPARSVELASERLRTIAICMEGYGERIQYPVVICDLSDQEAVLMRGDVQARMKQSKDSVMIINLGRRGFIPVPVPRPP
jgi:CRISPR/Cas system-associated endoribonuclease Cas2